MKHYILLTHTISGLGGGELYTLRRAQYLLNKKYKVTVIDHKVESNFILKDKFVGCNIIHEPLLIYPISYYSPQKSNFIIKELIDRLNLEESDFYIESHGFELGIWGEILAIKLKARHLIYCYEEWRQVKNYWILPGRKFLIRKYLVNEFYGCTSESIKILFGEIFDINNYLNIPFDRTEIKEKTYPHIELYPDQESFTIATVSRLEKTYLDNLIEDVEIFAKKYPNQKIHLIIGGNSKKEQRFNDIKNKCDDLKLRNKNVNVTLTGYIYELGKDLYEVTDVFIGMGTASINAISQGTLTINIDPLNNNLSSGFFGIDTYTAAFSESNKYFTIFEKIEEAYCLNTEQKSNYRFKSLHCFENYFSVEAIFPKLDKVIQSIDPAKENIDLEYSFLYHLLICSYFKVRALGGKILRKLGLKK